MIICEYEFDFEDPKNKGYSMTEIDWYGWIPPISTPNHRLTLRKNLRENVYEVFRYYYDSQYWKNSPMEDEYNLIVRFKSKSLKEAIDYADAQWNIFHGVTRGSKEPDEVCLHKTCRFADKHKGIPVPF